MGHARAERPTRAGRTAPPHPRRSSRRAPSHPRASAAPAGPRLRPAAARSRRRLPSPGRRTRLCRWSTAATAPREPPPGLAARQEIRKSRWRPGGSVRARACPRRGRQAAQFQVAEPRLVALAEDVEHADALTEVVVRLGGLAGRRTQRVLAAAAAHPRRRSWSPVESGRQSHRAAPARVSVRPEASSASTAMRSAWRA